MRGAESTEACTVEGTEVCVDVSDNQGRESTVMDEGGWLDTLLLDGEGLVIAKLLLEDNRGKLYYINKYITYLVLGDNGGVLWYRSM